MEEVFDETRVILPEPAESVELKNQPVPMLIRRSRYLWLKKFIEMNSFTPTYRTMAAGWGITRGAVRANLDAMEEFGWIKRVPGTRVIRCLSEEVVDGEYAATTSGKSDNPNL